MKIQTQTKAFALVLLLIAATSNSARADGSQGSVQAIIPSPADAVISQVNHTLRGTNSLTASFSETDTYSGQYRDLKQSGTIRLERPGNFLIDIQRFRRVSVIQPWQPSGNNTKSVSDGTTYNFVFLHPHSEQVQTSPATSSSLRSALRSVPPLAQFFSNSQTTTFPEQAGPAVLLNNIVWNKKTYQVLQYPVLGGDLDTTVATAYIGGDHLIHRLIYSISGDDATSTKEWTLDHYVLGTTIPNSSFIYNPPADATTLDRYVAGDLLSPGTSAPDFTAFDRSGNPVKLSDFHGKTVILDFWATWCWPCNQSLPQTEAVAEKYHDQGVVVLAVAIRDGKTGFDLWLKRHNYPDINFVRDPNSEGKDAASILYNVSTTPTAYIISPSGEVVRSISGYSGPTKELEYTVASTVAKFQATATAY